MSIKKFTVLVMISAILHLCCLASAFADGLSSSTGGRGRITTTEETSKSTTEFSKQSSRESAKQTVIVALVLLGVGLLVGGIVLTVVLTRKTQREKLVNEGYRGDGQLLRLLARQSGLSVEKTASIIRQANRKASKEKNRVAIFQDRITTGIVAARFRVAVKDVDRINHNLNKSRKLTSCDKGRLLFTRLCALAKAKRTLSQNKLTQQCSRVKKLRLCKQSPKTAQREAPL